jgi:negative regulator of flagellin synthesis FlgM
MSNPLSGIFSGSPSLDKATLEKAKRKAIDTPQPSPAETSKAKAAVSREDQVQLSDIAQKAMAEPAFDRSKVESIKLALQQGNYPLNSRAIAESFVAMEKLIG